MSVRAPSDDPSSAYVARRRARAWKRRRRRLLLADATLGVILAALIVLFGPGLALIALGGGVILLACLASVLVERALRSSARRGHAPDARERSGRV